MIDLRAVRVLEGTKISHDYKDQHIETFSYRDLCERGVPSIGIPCKMNRLLIVDVDVAGENHKKDGREWWANFASECGIPQTYTVQTKSGGYHFYFRLPESVNSETFNPPKELAPGVDLKWNGWVGAPPTLGYIPINGNLTNIVDAPPSLMAEISRLINTKYEVKEFNGNLNPHNLFNVRNNLSDSSIIWLRENLKRIQSFSTLTRDEWRDGLFSIKAGIDDVEVQHELATLWTLNQSYTPGDEHKAIDIMDRAQKHGPIGPGTIIGKVKDILLKHGHIVKINPDTPWDPQTLITNAQLTSRLGKDGFPKPLTTETNAAKLIAMLYDNTRLYHDVRQDAFIFEGKEISHELLLSTLTPMLQDAQNGLGLDFKMSTISSALDIIMSSRRYDPHLKWLESLEWDGQSRIDNFFQFYVGAEDSEYMRAVSKNFWISMAARGLKPGTKVDSMVILEGHEGIRKSSLVQAIGGKYTFAPSTEKVMDDLDNLRQMHQAVIVEIPELMGLMGHKPTKVQAFITKPFDNIRGLFAKRAVKMPRGFILVGTTNNSKYLSIDMGVRRFWPVAIPAEVKTINLWAVEADREQLFAEAVVRFRSGESFHEVPKEDHKNKVRSRALSEPLIGTIDDISSTMGPEFKISDIYVRLNMGGFIQCGLTTQISKRIEDALKQLGAQEIVSPRGSCWTRTVQNNLSDFL